MEKLVARAELPEIVREPTPGVMVMDGSPGSVGAAVVVVVEPGAAVVVVVVVGTSVVVEPGAAVVVVVLVGVVMATLLVALSHSTVDPSEYESKVLNPVSQPLVIDRCGISVGSWDH